LACSLVGVDVSLNLLVGSPWRFIFSFMVSFYFLVVVGLLVSLLDCFICNFTASFSVSVVVLLVLVFGGRYCFFSFASVLFDSGFASDLNARFPCSIACGYTCSCRIVTYISRPSLYTCSVICLFLWVVELLVLEDVRTRGVLRSFVTFSNFNIMTPFPRICRLIHHSKPF
jgi:hypothetical protein